MLRILAEVTDPDPETATGTAKELLHDLGTRLSVPILLHGEDGGAWPVLRLAARLNLDVRIGLEDTLGLPDGSPPPTTRPWSRRRAPSSPWTDAPHLAGGTGGRHRRAFSRTGLWPAESIRAQSASHIASRCRSQRRRTRA